MPNTQEPNLARVFEIIHLIAPVLFAPVSRAEVARHVRLISAIAKNRHEQ